MCLIGSRDMSRERENYMSHIPRDIVLPDQLFRQAARSGSRPASIGRLTKKTAVIAISGPPQVDRADLQLLGVHMFRYVATILVAILLSAPLVAGITPFPASFHTQMVPTNGTSLYVRVGGKGPAVVLWHSRSRRQTWSHMTSAIWSAMRWLLNIRSGSRAGW